jgi:hypothetical protein
MLFSRPAQASHALRVARQLTYHKSIRLDIFESMSQTVRTSLDIPKDLHRRIHEAAKRRGCSARGLILSSIEREVAFVSGARGRVKAPLVLSKANQHLHRLHRKLRLKQAASAGKN